MVRLWLHLSATAPDFAVPSATAQRRLDGKVFLEGASRILLRDSHPPYDSKLHCSFDYHRCRADGGTCA